MPAGLQILNDDFMVQIDDSLGLNLKFVASFTYNKVGSRDARNNVVDVPIPANIPTDGLILAVRPEISSAHAFRAFIQKSRPSSGNIRVQVASPMTGLDSQTNVTHYRVSFTGYLFVSVNEARSTQNFGLEVFTADQKLAFSSSDRALRVSNVYPTGARSQAASRMGWWSWRSDLPINSIANKAFFLCGGRSFYDLQGRYGGGCVGTRRFWMGWHKAICGFSNDL